MGPHEPYWRTNTSFSPPPSRWDFRFQSEGMAHDSHDGFQVYESSTSSNSKESRTWVRGGYFSSHQHSASDGAGLFLSSPSDLSPGPQWTPPTIQEISIDDYGTATRRDSVVEPLSFTPTMEGTSANPDSGDCIPSSSDSSESEPTFNLRLSSRRNFSSRRSFMSKAIHPLSFSTRIPTREASDSTPVGFSELDAGTPQREVHCWSSASSSVDFADVSEPFETEIFGQSYNSSNGYKCGLCERFLSQRSPWGSRRIVKSSDMPVAAILSCHHVFHAECLEQTTSKTHKSDPPCPLCVRSEKENNSVEQRVFPKLRNSFPRVRPFSEEGPSKPWGCTQVGDCVEGALHTPSRNTMLLLNRNHIKKNISLKRNSSKDFPGKLRKSALHTSQLWSGKSVQGAVGCSKTTTAGPIIKR